MKKLFCLLLIFVLTFACAPDIGIVFAQENSEVTGTFAGDVNRDGKIDAKDAGYLRRYLAGNISMYEIDRLNSDVNGDNRVTVIDLRYIRQYLAKEKEEFSTKNSVKLSGKYTSYAIDELSDSMVICGRAVLSGRELKLSQTASGLRFVANCEGDIVFEAVTEKDAYMTVYIDENYDNPIRIAVGKFKTIYSCGLNIEKGKHTIEILKATEWSQNALVTLTAVTVVGTKASEKSEKNLKIEFYGDSITSGFGNLCDDSVTANHGSWKYQDGTMTYASYAAHALNADYAVASASGHGVLGGFTPGDTVNSYKKFFDYSLVSEKTLFSRADYGADFIVINFGTNDNERVKAGGEYDAQAFEAECSAIIEQMHNDNPKAHIIWTVGMMFVSSESPVYISLQKVDEKYDYVSFYNSVAMQNGGAYHPSVSDHKELGKALADYILELS